MSGSEVFLAGHYWEAGDGPDTESITRLDFDPAGGAFERTAFIQGLRNASYFAVHSGRRLIAAVSETPADQGAHLALYSYQNTPERPALLAESPVSGGHPCFVGFAPDGSTLVVANYRGTIGDVYQIEDGPRLCHLGGIDVPSIASSHPRQGEPHGHFALITGSDALIFDLGGNCLWRFPLATGAGSFGPAFSRIDMHEGDGPRHGLIVGETSLLVVNELSSSLVLMEKSSDGRYVERDRHLLGGGAKGNQPAAIKGTRDGAFVYVSNRGADTLECFAISESMISKLAECPVGATPRDFCLSGDERYLLVACQDDWRIEVYSRDEATGAIRSTRLFAEMPRPACIQRFEP